MSITPPSKEWMDAPRHSAQFLEGVESFIRPDRKWHIVLKSPKRRSRYVNAFEDPYVFTGIAKESSLTAANLDDNSNSEEAVFEN
ncbi:hypothetical protein MKW98_017507 [Papaver atlanticum]|uniref:Uncharacterized protein n=1 Tax=Papaver atlanticum TaxID=357466 RepID=A0AAD4TBD4_9MAGN|nr:hypothetical protein MKW98_017507 [Papaver atlanticum]